MSQEIAISVIGIGKLGAPMAACLAARGCRVVAVDNDARKVESINRLRPPVFETGLADMLAATEGRLTATTDTADAVLRTDVTFIIVPTPSDETGGFSLKFVLPVCRQIGQALRMKQRRHVVVLSSTVMPGSTGGTVAAMLEESSGKRVGDDLGLCYSPEFIALGSVIRDYLHPDFILIGESDPSAGDLLESIYERVCDNEPSVARMNFVNAELAKIAVNSFITTKITFANMLAGICQNLPGANVDHVTAALGMDSRIGRKYLKGGVGYGGPCFPRDNAALAVLARQVDGNAELAQTVDHSNRGFVARLAALIQRHVKPGATVGVLGLAYKPDTDVIEQSQGVLLARALLEAGLNVVAYDPAAMPNARVALGESVHFVANLPAMLREADALVLVTPWNEFRDDLPELLRQSSRQHLVVDCWRLIDGAVLGSACRYVAVGVGPGSSAVSERRTGSPTVPQPSAA